MAEVLEAALEAVGPGDSPPRAILLSWLAQEYYWVDPQGRCADLHNEAIAMARRLGDEGTLAHALSRANFVDITPEAARDGVEVNTEVIGLARKLGDRELEVRSHVLRLNNHLELGDIPAVDRDLDAYARLATELRQPQHLWHIPLLRGMRAMIDGRFEEAEELALEARAGGERAGEPLAQQFFADPGSLNIYRQQGRLEEIADDGRRARRALSGDARLERRQGRRATPISAASTRPAPSSTCSPQTSSSASPRTRSGRSPTRC